MIVIPSVSAYWYVSGRRAAFGELLLMLSTVLLGSYLFFILLPVDSPYYLSPRLGPPLSGHFFFDLVHQMSARGGARGGAFPSAHVSGAVVVSLVAWRHQRRLAYLLVPITGSVMIAAVYGRFHYVLDTLAGAALAIAVVVGYRYLFGVGPGERQSAGLANASLDRSAASASLESGRILARMGGSNWTGSIIGGWPSMGLPCPPNCEWSSARSTSICSINFFADDSTAAGVCWTRAAARDVIFRFSCDTASMCGQWMRTLLLFARFASSSPPCTRHCRRARFIAARSIPFRGRMARRTR